GLASFLEPESGLRRVVDTGRAATRERFRRQAKEFDIALQQDIRRCGAELVRLETGESYAEPLIAFFRRRERMYRR
ncbi:MAG TPA: hypothetical protein VFZ87_01035, partial [Gemmatimonadales bacterium]